MTLRWIRKLFGQARFRRAKAVTAAQISSTPGEDALIALDIYLDASIS